MRRANLVRIASICVAALSLAACQTAANSDAASPNSTTARERQEFRELVIPAGTTLAASLDESVGSATSRVDEPVRAHLTRAASVDGVVALPAGSELEGAVVEALRSARVKGRARVAIRFDSVRAPDGGETYPIRSPEIARTAPGQMKKDAAKIGIPAAAGAVIGGILGGGKGAAIGAGVGAGGGTAYVMSERGPEVSFGHGEKLSVRLLEPVKVRVRASADVVN